ncbi:hypothetical protein Avbf_06703 [Armadillidium vulgare]|nr:hypothetical protein Avbf_06703 [Armadillidium vulgare]
MDIGAAKDLATLYKEYETAGVVVVFASVCDPALEVMATCGAKKEFSEDVFFHSVPDAVAFLMSPSAEPSEISDSSDLPSSSTTSTTSG